jgi:hypothetical protein
MVDDATVDSRPSAPFVPRVEWLWRILISIWHAGRGLLVSRRQRGQLRHDHVWARLAVSGE